MAPAPQSEGRRTRLAEQRRNLPDGPGVYLFHDAKGRVIYVGKAKSIRKRVASHFSNPVTRGAYEMVDAIESVEFLLVASETEALLAEQNFIKQYQPRFNIRLRDDKSYPYIAISMDEEFPRVYFTREKHRRTRRYFGPYSSAKRTRSTLETLGKVFQYRSCQGPEPGRRSGSPCHDYYIKRCGAPCVDYGVTREQYMESIDGVIAFLSGRYRDIERDLLQRMKDAAGRQEFEQAALERNRLNAVRSLLQRQRVANEAVGTLDVVAIAADATDANAQVFQLRDGRGPPGGPPPGPHRGGLPAARGRPQRPPVVLPRQRPGGRRRGGRAGVPAPVLRRGDRDPAADRHPDRGARPRSAGGAARRA